MSDFVQYVFSYLTQAMILLVPAAILCAAFLLVAAKWYQKKYHGERKFPWGRAILILAVIGYLLVVCYVTLVSRGHFGTRDANLHLFRAWREAWNSFSERSWLNILLNIAMFVPLGILLPLLKERQRKWYVMLPAVFAVTFLIEIIQYVGHRGVFDVDDLFCNGLGAMVGFWMVMGFLSVCKKRWGKALCHALALAAVAGSIGGIFVAYDAQEYGNLPTNPAVRVNTGDIQWTVACELQEETQTVDIYRTRSWTRSECEAFGREFLENIGVEDVDVTIYNDEVYLREHQGNRWLEVFYQGGYYSFADFEDRDILKETTDQAGEAELRAALLAYGIEIPDEAEFSFESGVHHFRVNRHAQGDAILDGTVTVLWEEGYGIRDIENNLIRVTYYGRTEILSPKAAAQRIMDGYISSGDWLEKKAPKQIEIRSCELSWQVDTKGFYQPVYLIELKSTDTNYEIIETVPAIK